MTTVAQRHPSSLIVAALACCTLAGCSSVQVIKASDSGPVPDEECQVTVYQTYQQATSSGPIEELCVINGTSSGSFNHSITTAIQKHKHKACACGATNAYIQSQTQSGLDVATVTLVAFRYVKAPASTGR